MKAVSFRFLLFAALPLAAAPPAVAQGVSGDDARCWIAVRVTGPETMRVTEREAEERLRLRCRAGDALVLLTDLERPIGGMIARYCDMGRPFLVEHTEARRLRPRDEEDTVDVAMAICTYRGAPRGDR
ncbi:hypothetical protein GXW78_26405 [Roseomonas terrae]|uniref:Uncharacterized protein n=2 Tax=Neoroseomonas terrae TaxID=424799 RepID=A0ABS5EQA7_9PROT|nr:hypothetical protein [Neoroseomonas terrae]